ARARGHLKKEPMASGNQGVIGCIKAAQLVRAGLDILAFEAETCWVRNGAQRGRNVPCAMQTQVCPAFEIRRCGEAENWPGISNFIFPEVMLASIAEQNEWDRKTECII